MTNEIQELEKLTYFAMESGEGGFQFYESEDKDDEELDQLAAEGWLTGSIWWNARDAYYEIEALMWYSSSGRFKMEVNETDRDTALKAFFAAYEVLVDKYANG